MYSWTTPPGVPYASPVLRIVLNRASCSMYGRIHVHQLAYRLNGGEAADGTVSAKAYVDPPDGGGGRGGHDRGGRIGHEPHGAVGKDEQRPAGVVAPVMIEIAEVRSGVERPRAVI